jgi:hypothetical protein
MSEKPENPSAFPSQPRGQDGLPVSEAVPGMSLRDYFAGQALASIELETHGDDDWYAQRAPRVAKRAYLLADAMLATRAGAPC